MTEKHQPTGYWLLWCDKCKRLAPPLRDRDAQHELAKAKGWHLGRTDLCPACRPKVLKDLPELLAKE